MTLYHATKKSNQENIENNGLIATEGMANALGDAGVYGFDKIESARDFAIENSMEDQYVIFNFEAFDAEIDPEYESGAYVVHHNVSSLTVAEIGDE